MIRVRKDYAAIPEGLTSGVAQHWIGRALSEGRNHNANAYVYRHNSVVKSLREIYTDKCGYCETLLGVSSSIFIDHYRPKRSEGKRRSFGLLLAGL